MCSRGRKGKEEKDTNGAKTIKVIKVPPLAAIKVSRQKEKRLHCKNPKHTHEKYQDCSHWLDYLFVNIWLRRCFCFVSLTNTINLFALLQPLGPYHFGKQRPSEVDVKAMSFNIRDGLSEKVPVGNKISGIVGDSL